MKVLKANFFERDSFLVAQELLGFKLCRNLKGAVTRSTINEVEVYDGFKDRASHAFEKIPFTGRAGIMFGPPGCWYVYLCYGVHWMLNIVTREKGYPAALLLRGTMETSGPGRLTQSLVINSKFNGLRCSPKNGLWIESSDPPLSYQILKTPRIGVSYAGKVWSEKKYRFVMLVNEGKSSV